MRILHVINALTSGGAEKLLADLLPIFNKTDGIEAELLLLTDKNNVFDKALKEQGVNIHIVPLRKIYSPLNIVYLRKYIAKGSYDIVHAHLFPAFYWLSIACRFTFGKRPKLVFTEHNTYNRRMGVGFFKIIERRIYSNYDCIISISNETNKNITAWLNPSEKDLTKYVVIENGIDVDKFACAKPYDKSEINNEFSNKTRLVCMTGRFTEQKDQETLIKAMKNISENVHLILLGEGYLIEKSERLVMDLELESRVHFLGFRGDVDRIFKTSDIVVLSSHFEGFGLVAVEGMAAGKPVIASDVPGLSDVVKDAGILFQKGNAIELASKIDDLLSNNEKYSLASQQCFERAQNFSIYTMSKRYVGVYKNI